MKAGFLEVLGECFREDEPTQVQVKRTGSHEVVVVVEEAGIERGGRDWGLQIRSCGWNAGGRVGQAAPAVECQTFIVYGPIFLVNDAIVFRSRAS